MKEWQPPVFESLDEPFMVSTKIVEGEVLLEWLGRCLDELGLPPFDEDKGLVGALHAAFERIEALEDR